MADKNTIKSWFETDDMPTQSQFWAWIDSFWHKEEKIPITAIYDIENILNDKADAEAFNNHIEDTAAHADLFNGKEDKENKGIANGYAPLDEFARITSQFLNIVDDLVTGGSTALLSAEQGKALQGKIDAINLILTSDDVNLDTLQEIVNAIKDVDNYLSTILVNDFSGGTTKALTAEMGKQLELTKLDLTSSYVYNTYFVSSISGVNANGQFQNPDRPYLESSYIMALPDYNINRRIIILN